MKQKPVIILGNGGHALVLGEILLKLQYKVIGFTNLKKNHNLYDFPFLGDDSIIHNYSPDKIYLVNGIGSASDLNLRSELFKQFNANGFRFLTLIHPQAIVSDSAKLSEGVQIMAGAVVQPFSSIGKNSIVNTGALIDHECMIEQNCHIAPGSVLCGNVRVGSHTFMGANSTIKQNVIIAGNNVIGANSFVNKNTSIKKKYIGIPAKEVTT